MKIHIETYLTVTAICNLTFMLLAILIVSGGETTTTMLLSQIAAVIVFLFVQLLKLTGRVDGCR